MIGLYVFFFVFLLFDYHKAIIAFLPCSFFLAMFPIMEGAPFTFDGIGFGLITAMFMVKKMDDLRHMNRYPFFFATIFIFLSLLVTNLFAETHWPSTIFLMDSAYLYPMIYWFVLDDEKYVDFAVKTLLCFAVVFLGYLLVETAFQQNYFIEYLVDSRIVTADVWNYTEVRFGLKRMQSIFFTPMSMGIVCAVLFFLFYEWKLIAKEKSIILSIVLFGCFVAPWLTGSRSSFAAMAVMLAPILVEEMKKPNFILLKFFLVGSAIFGLGSWFLTIVDSFVDSSNAVNGSSLDMRLEQFLVAAIFFMRSPIFGNGLGFVWTFVSEVDKDIFGAESVWLQLMIDYGVLGLLSFSALYISVAKKMCKLKGTYVFYALSIVVGLTLSTFLGVSHAFFLSVAVLVIKIHEFYCIEEVTEDESVS